MGCVCEWVDGVARLREGKGRSEDTQGQDSDPEVGFVPAADADSGVEHWASRCEMQSCRLNIGSC